MYSNEKWISKLILTVAGVFACSGVVSGQVHGNFNFAIQFALPAPDEARDLFNEGLNLYDQHRFADAEKKFREVVTKFSKSSIADRADYYFIRTLTQLGRRSEALSRIDGFARAYPQSRWRTDIEELRIGLTNQIPPARLTLLIS